ncbi:MAG: YfbR-like 5'-deoxynucleotidase [Hyphomicrobiaceae bacterium]
MLSGRRLNLLDPKSEDIEILDIAHGLARLARWNGQTVGEHAFTVAQHSLLVEQISGHIVTASSSQLRLAALLHDAAEYVLGDLISPFKSAIGSQYAMIEHRLQAAIHRRFGLPEQVDAAMRSTIKSADRIAAYYEATELAGFSEKEARQYFGHHLDMPPILARSLTTLSAWQTAEAQGAFLERFSQLTANSTQNGIIGQ